MDRFFTKGHVDSLKHHDTSRRALSEMMISDELAPSSDASDIATTGFRSPVGPSNNISTTDGTNLGVVKVAD